MDERHETMVVLRQRIATMKKAEPLTFQHTYQTMWDYHRLLKEHYRTVQEHYQAVLKLYQSLQKHPPRSPAYLQRLHEYHHALRDYHRMTLELRRTVQDHLHMLKQHVERQNRRKQAQSGQQLLRKTILIGEIDEEAATFLKNLIEQATSHRVFLASDRAQLFLILQSVRVDLLIVDDMMIPTNVMAFDEQLHAINGAEAPRVIVMRTRFNRCRAEIEQCNLVGLDKPIMIQELLSTIDKLFI
jgi:hypothetical protein